MSSHPSSSTDVIYGIVPKHILGSVAPKDIPTHPIHDEQAGWHRAVHSLKEYQAGRPCHARRQPELSSWRARARSIRLQIREGHDRALSAIEDGRGGLLRNVQRDALRRREEADELRHRPVRHLQLLILRLQSRLDGQRRPLFQDVKVRQALCLRDRPPGDRGQDPQRPEHRRRRATMPILSWAYQPDKITLKYDSIRRRRTSCSMTRAGRRGRTASARRTASGSPSRCTRRVDDQDRRWVHGRLPGELARYRRRDEAAVTRSSASSSPASRKTFDFEAFFVGFSWGVDPDQQTMWDSKQHGPGFNFYAYKQRRRSISCSIRRLHTLDQAKRKQILCRTCRISSLLMPRACDRFPEEHLRRQQARQEPHPERGERRESLRRTNGM